MHRYATTRYAALYDGISLTYRLQGGSLAYDIVVAPGADPAAFWERVAGAAGLRVAPDGALALATRAGMIRDAAPVAYQLVGGVRRPVAASYRLGPAGSVSFRVGRYDHSRPLVVDPSLVAGTYLGGNAGPAGGGASTEGRAVATDAHGDVYVAGDTNANDLPTVSATQPVTAGGTDGFVAEFDPTLSRLIYCTYLGGSSFDEPLGLAVDGRGAAYVTGYTGSTDFPTRNATQATRPGNDSAFVTALDPSGSSLLYSTYLGGSVADFSEDIAVDTQGDATVVGRTVSPDLPVTRSLFPISTAGASGPGNGFVARLTPSGSWATGTGGWLAYVGGDGYTLAMAAATDAQGNAYVGGYTYANNLPTAVAAQPAVQASYGGNEDGYLAEISADGTRLLYASYLGGSQDDQVHGLAVGGDGTVYVTGQTNSPDFPTKNAPQAALRGGSGDTDAFVVAISLTVGLVYATYWGGSYADYGNRVRVDAAHEAYVAGTTSSPDFPVGGYPLALAINKGVSSGAGVAPDAFLAKFRPFGSQPLYSTYLGGSQGDQGFGLALVEGQANVAYVTGYTQSPDVPMPALTFDATPHLGGDAFVLGVSDALPPTPTATPTGLATATATSTAPPSATASPSATPTLVPTATASPSATASPTSTSRPTATATWTPTPTATRTLRPTATPCRKRHC